MYLKLGTTNIQYIDEYDDFIILAELINSKLSYERPMFVRSSDELDIWYGEEIEDREYLLELLYLGKTLYLYRPISSIESTEIDDYIDYTNWPKSEVLYYNELQLPDEGEYGTVYRLVNIDNLGIETVSTGEYGDLTFDWYIWYDSEWIDVLDLDQNSNNTSTVSLNNRDTLAINNLGTDTDFPGFSKLSFPIKFEDSSGKEKYLHLGFAYDTSGSDFSSCPDRRKYLGTYVDSSPTDQSSSSSYWSWSLIGNLGPSLITTIDVLDGGIYYFHTRITNRYISTQITTTKDPTNEDWEYTMLGYSSYYPKYVYNSSSEPEYNYNLDSDIFEKYYISLDDVVSEKKTLALDLEYIDLGISSGYIIVPDSNGIMTYIKYGSVGISSVGISREYYDRTVEINSVSLESIIDCFVSKLGYSLTGDSTVYISCPIDVTYFYNFPGFSYTPNSKISFELVAQYSQSQNDFQFISKTMGYESEEALITLEISELSTLDYFRLVVTRFGYSEIYEGSTLDIINSIGTDSKLITVSSDYNRATRFTSGSWVLRGSVEETFGATDYKKGLDVLVNYGDPIYPDYIMIPDPTKYINAPSEYSEIYLSLVDYTTTLNCQALIGNSTENYIYNLTTDTENRLLYFYDDMTFGTEPRPSYYAFLRGLLEDTYAVSVSDVKYISPVTNPYTDEDIEDTLANYKSNYMVSNNQIYYYKKYMNGEDYETTGWMRFCLGKISRQLQKHKWEFLSLKFTGDIQTNITTIISRVASNFSIINRLGITEFDIDYENNTISLTIETYMSDLVDNNVSLNITLNYNE